MRMFKQYRQLSRNTISLSITVGLVLTAYFAWSPLIALHIRDLGATELEVGLAFSIFTLANYLPAMLGGMIADRFGRKWVITAPGLLLAPLYIAAGLTQNWITLTILLSCTNFFGAMQWPAMQALMSESDEERRATAFSLMEVFVLGAAIIGPLASSFVLPTVGISGLIIAHGIILIPASIIRMLELRETHQPRQRTTLNSKNWRKTFPKAVLWVVAANTLLALALGLSFEGPFGALLANDIWRLDEVQIQWLNAAGAAAALLGVWLGSKADVWGSKRIWVGAALGFGVMLAGWGLSPTWEIGLFFFLGANIFYEAIFIVAAALVAQYSTRATRSSVFGFQTTAAGFATAAGPTLGAWSAAVTTLAAPFLIAAVSMIASLGLLTKVKDAPVSESKGMHAEDLAAVQMIVE